VQLLTALLLLRVRQERVPEVMVVWALLLEWVVVV
jgi:hypothetical protein